MFKWPLSQNLICTQADGFACELHTCQTPDTHPSPAINHAFYDSSTATHLESGLLSPMNSPRVSSVREHSNMISHFGGGEEAPLWLMTPSLTQGQPCYDPWLHHSPWPVYDSWLTTHLHCVVCVLQMSIMRGGGENLENTCMIVFEWLLLKLRGPS